MSNIATGVAIGAATNGGVAAAQAAQARRVACDAFVKGYEHNTATVQERREYAECIRLTEPVEMSGGATVLLKVCIVFGLIGGAYVTWRESRRDDNLVWLFVTWVMSTTLVGLVPFVVSLIAYAAYWVVTA